MSDREIAFYNACLVTVAIYGLIRTVAAFGVLLGVL